MRNLLLFLLLAMACAPESVEPTIAGIYTVTDDTGQWTWNFSADGSVLEQWQNTGGCGEWSRGDKDTFVVISGLWKARYVGRLYPAENGWTFEHQYGTFTLTRV